MRAAVGTGGGFASAEDADSEGEEGRFYVWTAAELAGVLTPDELRLAREWYGVTDGGNFEGANVLHRPAVGEPARPPAVEALRAKLFDLRAERVRPGLDDKVLTEWNALMISALAEAGAAAGEPGWVEAATDAIGFLEAELLHDGRWYRSWQRIGGRRHPAYAADYAALTDAYTRLGEGHRPAALARGGAGHRRGHARSVLGRPTEPDRRRRPGDRRPPHRRAGCGAASGRPQGSVRQPRPVGQRQRCLRPPSGGRGVGPTRPDRPGRGHPAAGRRRDGHPTAGPRPPADRLRPRGGRDERDRGGRRPPRSAGRGAPAPPAGLGAGPRRALRRGDLGRSERRPGPTSAGTTPAACQPRTRPPWPPSSTPSDRPGRRTGRRSESNRPVAGYRWWRAANQHNRKDPS